MPLLVVWIILMFGAVYLLLWRPQQRRIAMVRELQSRLRVGDDVLTTSGIYGLITRVNDKSIQLQIADKVRIEIARQAIGGYQGQDPVVPESGTS